jgi:uncharacterized membrane protein
MAKMDMLEKKKDGKEIDPMHKKAKMSMLKALRDEMSGMMSDDLHGHKMKKVEVASNDSKGLEEGLDKAKQLIHSADHDSNSDQLGQDEKDEHGVKSPDMWDVSPEMEEDAEEGDSEEPEHEGEMPYSNDEDMHTNEHDSEEEPLSEEEKAHMHKLMSRHKKHSK